MEKINGEGWWWWANNGTSTTLFRSPFLRVLERYFVTGSRCAVAPPYGCIVSYCVLVCAESVLVFGVGFCVNEVMGRYPQVVLASVASASCLALGLACLSVCFPSLSGTKPFPHSCGRRTRKKFNGQRCSQTENATFLWWAMLLCNCVLFFVMLGQAKKRYTGRDERSGSSQEKVLRTPFEVQEDIPGKHTK